MDTDVATKYRENMSLLGVEISPTKSHVSNDTFELAKRWFYKGDEISPFPLNGMIENVSSPHGLATEIYDAIKKGWSTNLCQGIPSGNDIIRLLSMLGWSKRSIRLRAPDIECYLHMLIISNHEGGMDGDRSIRFLASLLGHPTTMGDISPWAEELKDIIKDIKTEGITNSITSALNKNAQSTQSAMLMYIELARVCDPLINPMPIALAVPYLRVLGLQTQRLQQGLADLQAGNFVTFKDIISVGNDITYPDPQRINSLRTSTVIVRRTGSLLHKLFKTYREIYSSSLDYP